MHFHPSVTTLSSFISSTKCQAVKSQPRQKKKSACKYILLPLNVTMGLLISQVFLMKKSTMSNYNCSYKLFIC